jgi:ribonucleoside-diphosphate reductase alpha chain
LGDDTIDVDGHLNMMAAVQPFLSGAISKTVNLPKGSTIEDIEQTYIKGWTLGLKSISVYVDCSKGIQPVNINMKKEELSNLKWGERQRLQNPTDRYGVNVDIGDTGVHIITGEYDSKKPSECIGDIFVAFGSSGSQQSAAYTSWSKEASRNLQLGIDIRDFIRHNLGANGVINGFTDHPFIKSCSSIEDFVAKWIKLEYFGEMGHCQTSLKPDDIKKLRCNTLTKRNRVEHYHSRIEYIDKIMEEGIVGVVKPLLEDEVTQDETTLKSGEKFCIKCGHPTVPSGANCFKCINCGDSDGCG